MNSLDDKGVSIALGKAITETVENMAFVQLLEQDSHVLAQYSLNNNRQVMLSIFEPVKGKLILIVSRNLMHELASNIYGPEMGDPSLEAQDDTIAELLNIIAGRFMKEITPPNQAYELGLPVIVGYSAGMEDDQIVNCVFESEKGGCLVLFLAGRDLIEGAVDPNVIDELASRRDW